MEVCTTLLHHTAQVWKCFGPARRDVEVTGIRSLLVALRETGFPSQLFCKIDRVAWTDHVSYWNLFALQIQIRQLTVTLRRGSHCWRELHSGTPNWRNLPLLLVITRHHLRGYIPIHGGALHTAHEVVS